MKSTIKNLLTLIGALTVIGIAVVVTINYAEANPCDLAQSITASLER